MKKFFKSKTLLGAVMSIALCVSLIAGATFAIFTSKAEVNIAVSSGKVNVTASVENLKLYSLENIDMTTYDGTETDRTANGNFINEGVATLNGNELVLDRMTPGDRVTFQIKLTNNSNVKVLYRYSYSIEKADGKTEAEAKKFYSALKFKLGEVETQKYAKYYTVWHEFVGTEPEILDVEVKLPAEANDDFQNSACKIAFKVEAVQGNAKVVDNDGETFGVADKEGLIRALNDINLSEEPGAKDIILSEDVTCDDETLTVAKNDVTLNLGGKTLNITSADLNGIEVENGASLTIEGGNGKLNINAGSGKAIALSNRQAATTGKTKLTIKDVEIDIANNASTKSAIYAYAENGEHNVEVNIEDGAVINAEGGHNYCVVQLANNAVLNVNGGIINASGEGSVFVAGRDNAGTDADDIVLNFNDGIINITGGSVLGIECNYFATANVNGGVINMTGDCDGAYAVGASFGGHININAGAKINVKATSGSAYAAATYGNYSNDRKSTITIANGAEINLGLAEYNQLADLYPYTVLIDERN